MAKLAIVMVVIMGAATASAAEWKLMWSDEFDYQGLPDKTKWAYEEGFVRNNELQYYTRERAENARVENGMLVLEARKERVKNAAWDPGKKGQAASREYADHTSASINTNGKASWRYGRIEVRAKLPKGTGMWPAIWMLGTNIKDVGWPACGEIDIMENVGFEPDTVHATVHTGTYNHVKGTAKGSSLKVAPPSENFHLYAIEWDREAISFLVDGQKYFTFKNEHTDAAAWPFDGEQYLLLNIAIGGSWGGQKGVDDSIFPQRMYVDYVRVYQKADALPAPGPKEGSKQQ